MENLGMFLNNPIVLLVVGLVIKFAPGVRAIVENKLIPIILTLLAWLGNIIGAPATVPSTEVALAAGLGWGFLGGLKAALWSCAQAWFLNEAMVRHYSPARPSDSAR